MVLRGRFSITAVALLACLIVAALLAGAGCGKKGDFSLGYNKSFANMVIRVRTFGGMPAPWDDKAPSFTLYGNGTVVMRGENGRVGPLLEGKMSEGDISALLEQIRDTGFFDLETWYEDRNVYDYTTTSVEVTLQERSQKVTIYFEKVDAFTSTLEAVREAPVSGLKDYVPGRGYLVAQKHQATGKDVVIEEGSDIYGLLPEASVLEWAVTANQPVAIDGKDFARIKRYAADHDITGLVLKSEGGDLILYPVYEPR